MLRLMQRQAPKGMTYTIYVGLSAYMINGLKSVCKMPKV